MTASPGLTARRGCNSSSHRAVRRRPQHRGEVPRGPRLVRRRQPAARPARHDGRTRHPQRRRHQQDRRGGRRPQPWLLRPTCTARSAALRARGAEPRVLFLEASDDELVRRFENVRRPHPLQGDGRLVDGIAARTRPAARRARRRRPGDRHLRASTCTSCAPRSIAAFADASEPVLRATVVSFGYKYGLPVDADLVVDCRFLPNPHWIPELRPLDGSRRGGRATTCSASPAPRSSSTATPSCCSLVARATSARASGT